MSTSLVRSWVSAAAALAVLSTTACGGNGEGASRGRAPDARFGGSTAGLLLKADAQGTVRVIVGVKTDFVPEGKLSNGAARMKQRGGIASAQRGLLARLSANPPKESLSYEYIPYVFMEVDSDGLERLMADPEVTSITEDRLVAPVLNTSATVVQAPTVWAAGYTGSGQAVAILDTGVDKTHSYLSGRVTHEACYSTTNAATGATTLCPDGSTASTATGSGVNCSSSLSGCSHGTHVAGIAAGSGSPYTGIAKGANIVAIQVFTQFTSTSVCGSSIPCISSYTSNWLSGLQRVQALVQAGTKIAAVNMSLGSTNVYNTNCDSMDPGSKAQMDTLKSLGVATVVASGNSSSTAGISYPACLSTAISVGSSTKTDGISSFSNASSILSILAPGDSIIAPVPGGLSGMSGTSMAAPHVAGAFTLMKSVKEDMTVAEALSALQNTGTTITDTRNGTSLAKPRININSALASMSATAPTFSPTGGAYTSSQTVTVTSPSGASLRYTTDGSDPTTTSGTTISSGGTVAVSSTTELKAIAYRSPLQSSSSGTVYSFAAPLTVNLSPQAAIDAGARWRRTTSTHETFENGLTGRFSWATSGNAAWAVTNAKKYEGSYSVKSPVLTHGQSATLSVTLECSSAGTVTWWQRVSSAEYEDYLILSVDGSIRTYSSGGATNPTWIKKTTSLTAGTHTISWAYSKSADGGSEGEDNVYLDHITFPCDEWRTSGTTVQGTPLGSTTLAFKDVTDYVTPSSQTWTHSASTATQSATYVRKTGSLTVTISPTAAASAGGQWRVDSGTWRSSGYTETGLTTGSHTVDFQAVDGYSTPSSQSATISYGATTSLTGTYVQQQIATPTFSVSGGTYPTAQSVSLSSTTSGATIRYTTDGSAPTASSTAFSTAISAPLGTTMTIKAKAFKTHWIDSSEASATYVITGTVATPTFSVSGGTYPTAQSVSLGTTTSGATVRYTTDGSAPTASSTAFSTAISIPLNSSMTLRAKAFKATWTDSAEASATYVITGTVSTPTFSVVAGTYPTAQSVSLSTTTSGATVRYTTDGSAPSASSPAYSTAISVPLNSSMTIRAKAFKTDWTESSEASATYVVTGTVATPTFSVTAGTYTAAQNVSLSTSTSGATIRYTTDGTAPTASSTAYSSAISAPLNATTVIRAKAFKTDWTDSAEASATYVITGTVATPTFSVAAGTYPTAQSVSLTTSTSGATVRYTTDGSAPTASSTAFSTAISIPLNSSMTLRAKAFKASWTDSSEASATYVITGTVAAPTFSVAGGTYTTAQSVSLSSTTSGATIRYTTDGSAPTGSSPVYSTALSAPLNATTVIRAKAFKTDWTDSAESTATYVVTGTVATPTFSPPGGSYSTAQTVTLSTTTPGATIRYTTDGSTPTASSTAYSAGIPVALESTVTIRAKAFLSTWADSAEASATYVVSSTVAAPTFSVPAGTYTSAQSVALSTTTPGATIRYTTDGSTPTASSSAYVNAISVPLQTTMVLRARAYRSGWTDSSEASATYVVTATVATPTFSVAAGTYTTAQSIALATTTSGATIRYTTDGSAPTASSPAYSTAIPAPLNSTTVVRAKAFLNTWADSAEASATYVITGTVATPTFSVAAGTYTTAQSLVLSTSTSGATVRYTTDGSVPTASSTAYSSAINLPLGTTVTVKAKAFKASWADSGEASATYEITGTVATPAFSVAGGTYTTAKSVSLSTTTSGASLRYTTDGSAPTASSPAYSTAISVPLNTTMTIKAKAFKTNWIDSSEASATYVITGTVATPTFSVAAGTYTTAQSVSLSTTTSGATVRYTTDGSTPTASSTAYVSAISIPLDATTTLKARAFKADWADSAEASATYVITGTVATPTFSVSGGTYTTAQSVALSTTTSGAVIRYTTDGSAPTASSTAYSAAISVPLGTTMTVKAKAFKSNWTDSAEASATYVITGTVATPSFSVAAGTYTTAQSVSLTTSTPGATLRYTTDGSTPTASSAEFLTAISIPLNTAMTIKAKAFKATWADSAEASATYVVTGTVATPTLSLAAGTYSTAQTVTISTTTSGATIRYTTDGSTPTASSTAYSSAINLPLGTTLTLTAKAFKSGWTSSAEVSGSYEVTGTVATPTFSIAAGTYQSAQDIELATATSGATLRYTTDGSTPTASSPAYTGAINIPVQTTRTIKAKAFKSNWADSVVASATYVITNTIATPTFSLAAGTYTTARTVTLSTTSPGAVIRYTTDGSTPTPSSTQYSTPVSLPLDTTTTIKARGFRPQWTESAVASATYVITGTVATPTFSVAAGTYPTAQTVTLSTSTADATVRYTTDGSAPTASSPAYTAPITVPLNTTMTVKARAFKSTWADSAEATATYVVTGTVAAPTFSVAAGTYTTAQSVSLSSTTSGATIRYTTDGSTPTASSTAYSSAISLPLNTTTTLKAKAFKTSWTESTESSATYVITGTVATPTFSVAAGTYSSAQDVSLSMATPGATVRYTTDGSTPTGSSTEYTAPIHINTSTTLTLKARAFKTDWADSAVATAAYEITGTVATPTFGLPGGTYSTAQTVTLTTATAGATIRYTTDGSAPSASSPVYSAAIAVPLEGTVQVRARAYKAGWADSAEASASYTVACTRLAPTVSIDPGSRSGAPGTEIGYSLTVQNNNTGCHPATFDLAATYPVGWTHALSASSVTLASGASSTGLTLSVTPPMTAVAGSEALGFSATDRTGGATASAAATCEVTCTRAPPTLAFSPSQQSGQAGTLLSWELTLTNRDLGCVGSAFNVSAQLPASWTHGLSDSSVTLASGASTELTLTTTSDVGAALGDQVITADVTRSESAGASASATYSVVPECTRGLATLTLLPAVQSGARGALLQYTATLTNHDVACPATSFATTLTLPSGWTGSSPADVEVASGASGTFTVSVTSPAGAAFGDFQAALAVTSAASGSPSANVTYTVVSTCTRANPSVSLVAPDATVTAPDTVHYAAQVTNHDTADCGASELSVSAALPTGWTSSAANQTVAAGATVAFDLQVTPPSTLLASSIPFVVTAAKTALPVQAATAEASYTLGCARAVPGLRVTAMTDTEYTLELTNRDPSACDGSSYRIEAVSSEITVSPTSLELAVAPGHSTAFTVSADAAAAPGDYAVVVRVTRTSDSEIVAERTVTVTVRGDETLYGGCQSAGSATPAMLLAAGWLWVLARRRQGLPR